MLHKAKCQCVTSMWVMSVILSTSLNTHTHKHGTHKNTTHTPTQLIMLHCPPLPIHQLTAHQLTAHQSPPTTLHPPAHSPPVPTHLWTCRSLLLSSAILNIRPTASSPWPLYSSSWVRGRDGLGGKGEERGGRGGGRGGEGRGEEGSPTFLPLPHKERILSFAPSC